MSCAVPFFLYFFSRVVLRSSSLSFLDNLKLYFGCFLPFVTFCQKNCSNDATRFSLCRSQCMTGMFNLMFNSQACFDFIKTKILIYTETHPSVEK